MGYLSSYLVLKKRRKRNLSTKTNYISYESYEEYRSFIDKDRYLVSSFPYNSYQSFLEKFSKNNSFKSQKNIKNSTNHEIKDYLKHIRKIVVD